MKYDFDEIIDRTNTNSENVDGLASVYFQMWTGKEVSVCR